MKEYKIVKEDGILITLIRERQEAKQFIFHSHDKIKLEVNGSDLWITDLESGERTLSIDNAIQYISMGWIEPV